MIKKAILLLALAFVHAGLAQQVIPCYTDEHQEEFLQQHPELRDDFARARQAIFDQAEKQMADGMKKSSGKVYTIPVVFHVIYNTAYDNISRAQILDALRILNEDYRRLNADASATRSIFKSRAADIEVEFALAKIAPDGSCTDGITRRQSALSVQADPRDQVKNLVQWDPKKYLNIWVVNSIKSSSGSGLTLGYANFPWMPASKDGIVVRHDALGQTGTSVYGGRTLTHEVGHYLGLLHTFQDGCSQGDGVGDTPPVASASFGCNLNRNSCSNDQPNLPDMIENYMDYSDDVCQNAFTLGQKSVMRTSLQNESSRKTLWTPANLTATGVDNPPCKPEAAFSALQKFTCSGNNLRFIDESENGAPSSWSWTFQSGSPSTSTQAEPVVNFAYPGTYDVSLTVSNSAGSSTVTYKNYVEVKPYYSGNRAQWQESFEGPSLDIPSVSVVSQSDTNRFEITGRAAKDGSQSLVLKNHDLDNLNEIDEFISPNIFTKFGENLFLNFDFAFAARQSTDQDELRVLVSEDCGETWTLMKVFISGALRSVAIPITQDFVPAANQWKSYSLPLVAYRNSGPILVKFQFVNGGGNNFYLDNINLTASNIGLGEEPGLAEISIYPNPNSGSFKIDFGRETRAETNLSLRDLSGKLVHSVSLPKESLSYQYQNLDLPAGLYLLEVKTGKSSAVHKLVLE